MDSHAQDELEMGFYTLRHAPDPGGPCWMCVPAGLHAEVLDFADRPDGAAQLQRFLRIDATWGRSTDLAAHVCARVEDGRLELRPWRAGGAAAAAFRTEAPPAEVPLPSLMVAPVAEAPPASAPPAATFPPEQAAQAHVLAAAARSANPFCEVCENPSAKQAARKPQHATAREASARSRAPAVRAAPQLGALAAAAQQGTPFCEVCTG